jgi:undecaprenyl-diphosphatase
MCVAVASSSVITHLATSRPRALDIASLQHHWFEQVNRFARATPALHAPMRLYAEYGVVLFAGLLLLSWWLARADGARAVAAALWAPVGMLLAVAVNQPLVNDVREDRPYTVFPHALVLVGRSHDYGFPSDHAVMAGAVAAGVLLAHRRLGAVTVVAALLLAFSRVYVAAHFPLDVVVGLILGAAVTVAGYLVVRRPLTALATRLTRTPLRPLLASGLETTRAEPTPGGFGPPMS